MNRKANVAVVLIAVLLFMLIVFFVSDYRSNITGLATYDPGNEICHQNLDSCIDLNGDGAVDIEDEQIFAYLINGTPASEFNSEGIYGRYRNGTPYGTDYFELRADFNGDNEIDDDIDFQRCFVPMRDEAVDKGVDDHINCNHDWEDNCTFGCPDLNGDGFVDEADRQILLNRSLVWENDNFTATYPMADINGDGVASWEDRFCMSRYQDEYALCNLPRYFKHTNLGACADLVNVSTDLGNDGFVRWDDFFFFDYARSLDYAPDIADFNNDGMINWKDKLIFDKYHTYTPAGRDKVVACNLYWAPWHTGFVDQNKTLFRPDSVPIEFKVFNNTLFYDINASEGWLTKIRINIASVAPTPINESITANITKGNRVLAIGRSNPVTEDGIVTIYFDIPPKLKDGKTYNVTFTANGALFTLDLLQTWMTTAHGDLNGDGIVDSLDDEIISKIPDGLTFNDTEFWNETFDLNDDNKIDFWDIQIFNTYANTFDYFNTTGIVDFAQEENQTADDDYLAFGNDVKLAKKFVADKSPLQIISIELSMFAGNDDWIIVNITDDDHNSIAGSAIAPLHDNNAKWYNVTFDEPVPLIEDLTYYVELSTNGTTNDAYRWHGNYG